LSCAGPIRTRGFMAMGGDEEAAGMTAPARRTTATQGGQFRLRDAGTRRNLREVKTRSLSSVRVSPTPARNGSPSFPCPCPCPCPISPPLWKHRARECAPNEPGRGEPRTLDEAKCPFRQAQSRLFSSPIRQAWLGCVDWMEFP